MDQKKFYVTTPIYYVTAKPHLGSVYSSVLADIVARWNKLQGKRTFFATGTDEHGQKVAKAAENANKNPKEFVDSFIPAYQDAFKNYEVEYDHFVRTTDPAHEKAVQDWLKMLMDKGEIYKSAYEGWYCAQCELFVKEKDSAGENEDGGKIACSCGCKKACEYDESGLKKCKEVCACVCDAVIKEDETTNKGTKILCPDCGRQTEMLSEECYFFRLSNYQDKLLKFYEENPDFVAPKERLNEVINFVKSGLKDLSISRTNITWGIPFPGDEKHVTYVWADALNNYITAVGYGNQDREKEFEFWWPADLHIMGKDILRFHAVYWPAFLMASGLKLPKKMLVHGWITVDKKKMSKSFGNAVDPVELEKIYGAEVVRYYLARQMAINQDGDFSIEDLEQKITSDLANDLGNLLNRMVALAQKNEIVELEAPKTWSSQSIDLKDAAENAIADFKTYMADYQFHMALAALWKFINKINSYFHTQEPWKLAKTNRDLFLEVMSATGHSLEVVGTLLWPIMPRKMEQLLGSLGLSFKIDGKLSGKNLTHGDFEKGGFLDGIFGKGDTELYGEDFVEKLSMARWDKKFVLHKTETLFLKPELRLEEQNMSEEIKDGKSENVAQNNDGKKTVLEEQSAGSGKIGSVEYEHIGIEDFAKTYLVVGTIETAEEVAGSDKLLRLMVDCGDYGKRQVFSGVKKYYKPEELVGKQGIFVINLKPRKIMGSESQGMMLFAQDKDGNFKFTTVSGFVANGTRLS